MAIYIVTVKLPRNKDHDPMNKKSGVCPASESGQICTDVTGEHHSILQVASSPEEARDVIHYRGFKHITRVEGIAIDNPTGGK